MLGEGGRTVRGEPVAVFRGVDAGRENTNVMAAVEHQRPVAFVHLQAGWVRKPLVGCVASDAIEGA